jgi:putative transposase
MLDPQGLDAGKKVTGRKRHILVDTLGLLRRRRPPRRSVGSRRPAGPRSAHPTLIPFIERIFADAGYQGAKTAAR